MPSLTQFFQYWRSTVGRDREIVDAIVAPAHRGPSAELATALRDWPGVHYWVEGDGDGRLMLVRSVGRPVRERWWLHVTLFAATFLTMWVAGAWIAGVTPSAPLGNATGLAAAARALLEWVIRLRPGLEFAMGLMAILLAHETGHYITAKRYGINVSPPYFLPAPPWPPGWFFVGTFGAFIRLRSPVADRQQLLDVGAAGPWAGFVVAVLLLAAGLSVSQPLPLAEAHTPQLIMLGGSPRYLGDSIAMWACRRLIVGDGVLLLHPLAVAGWLGLFVTALNLLPLGQLDGGHVLYSLIGRGQAWVGFLTWLGLVLVGRSFPGWWLWALFILILGRGSIAHPTVLDRYRPVPASRRPLGWATALLLVVTFTPVPLYI